METGSVLQFILAAALALVMLGLGTQLQWRHFKQLAAAPRAALIGIGCQLVLLPCCCLLVLDLFELPAPLAIGLLCIALCPGGITSNLFSLLARGDVALSIALTGIVSLITPFTLPILMSAFLSSGFQNTEPLEFPTRQALLMLVGLSILPTMLGMFVRWKYADRCQALKKVIRIGAVVCVVMIVSNAFRNNATRLPELISELGLPVVCLLALVVMSSWSISRLFRIESAQRRTITVEAAIQNGFPALFITGVFMKAPEMTIAPITYELTSMTLGTLVVMVLANMERRSIWTIDTSPRES